MHHGCELICEDLFCLVKLAALPGCHFIDLLERQEREHSDALHNVGIVYVAPVLIEIVRRCLVGVEPNGVAGGLTHFLALRVCEKCDGHCMSILAELAADKLCASEHIGPLVIAAELHIAAVVLIEVVKVVALHDHIVELKEAESLLHALLVALGSEHVVDGEACADLAQKLNVVEVKKPVGVVDHHCLAFAEVDKALHLTLEAVCIVLNILTREHFSHVCSARGITYHSSAAAYESNGLVACHLQTLHKRKSHEMSRGEAVCGAVKADVEGGLPVVDHRAYLFFVSDLSKKSSCLEFFVNLHYISPLLF